MIKDRSNGRYYAGNSVWTPNPEEAKVFDDLAAAFETAHADGLENCAVVVFRIGTRQLDAQFPIF